MNRKFLYLAAAIITAAGIFRPFVAMYGAGLDIYQIGTIFYSLYLLAAASLVLSLLNLFNPRMKYIGFWFGVVGGLGFLIASIAVNSGAKKLEILWRAAAFSAVGKMPGNGLALKLAKAGITGWGELVLIGFALTVVSIFLERVGSFKSRS